MLELTIDLQGSLEPEVFESAKRAQIDLGTARAADVLVGALHSPEAIHTRTGTLARHS